MKQSPVESHYSRDGLYEKIVSALKSNGIKNIKRSDIAAVDEFHVRGAEVSVELAREAGIRKGETLLDVGCGIGGPARMLAAETGCHVTGIDITADFIDTAKKLTSLVEMDGQVSFIQANALDLPFEDECFDKVWSQHVQMNIGDKKKFYDEIFRVLKPGGKFIWYDIFSVDHQPITFPVPWANHPSISHLVMLEEFKKILEDTGFLFQSVTNQTYQGITFFEKSTVNPPKPNSVSIPLILGDNAKEKFSNLLQNLKSGKLSIYSGICSKIGRV